MTVETKTPAAVVSERKVGRRERHRSLTPMGKGDPYYLLYTTSLPNQCSLYVKTVLSIRCATTSLGRPPIDVAPDPLTIGAFLKSGKQVVQSLHVLLLQPGCRLLRRLIAPHSYQRTRCDHLGFRLHDDVRVRGCSQNSSEAV